MWLAVSLGRKAGDEVQGGDSAAAAGHAEAAASSQSEGCGSSSGAVRQAAPGAPVGGVIWGSVRSTARADALERAALCCKPRSLAVLNSRRGAPCRPALYPSHLLDSRSCFHVKGYSLYFGMPSARITSLCETEDGLMFLAPACTLHLTLQQRVQDDRVCFLPLCTCFLAGWQPCPTLLPARPCFGERYNWCCTAVLCLWSSLWGGFVVGAAHAVLHGMACR